MQDFTKFSPNSQRLGVRQAALSGEAIFFQRVYAWMCAGLGLTALLSLALASSETWLYFLMRNNWILYAACFAELGVVYFLSARLDSLPPGTAKGLFLAYAALNAVCFSVLVVFYPPYAFFKAFICTAGIYGALAVYGLVAKRSLQAWGSFLFAGVVGLVLAMVVNFFMASERLDFIICILGVVIFAGLTAYDHQKLRVMRSSLANMADTVDIEEQESRAVIYGALSLYLDFINIFLFLLRLFGRRN